MRESIRWALVISALGHIALQAYSAWHGGWTQRHAGLIRAPGDGRDTGSPSLTGCYLAIVLPLAPWPLWPIFAIGLYWAFSWLSFLALAGAYLLVGWR